jgi:hypothetical protein
MEIEERLGRLATISKDRTELLEDLKDNVMLLASPSSLCCSCCSRRFNRMMSLIT